jgi:hypothetical protein
MHFNTKASNCLFVNVSIKTTPYSNSPVAIRVTAHNFEDCPANKALYYSELPFYNTTTLAVIQAKIEQFRAQNNSKSVAVKMQPKVLKFLQAQNVA